MKLKTNLFTIYCFIYLLQGIVAQEGTPCDTPSKTFGICINIKRCASLLNLLQTQSTDPAVRGYLQRSVCGYDGTTPMVCCPQSNKPKIIDPTEPETTPSSNNNNNNNQNRYSTLLRPPNCGFSNVTNTRVVGGIPALLGEFPWLVILGYRNSKNPNQPKWLCGGTLITEKHILTAGHCVHNRRDLYIARVGELDLNSDSDGAQPQTIPLINAKIHENYSPSTYTNDIAILTLGERITVPSVWPICLPVDEPQRSQNYGKREPLVAGWGSIYFNGPSSSHLQVVSLPVVSNEQCKRAFGNRSVIDDRVLCAGYLQGGKDACQGDSGGPLMLGQSENTNLRFHLIGVVSYGFRCAEAGYPGVYTRVTNFIDWIARNLN